MSVLKIKNIQGEWEPIRSIVGEKGDKGNGITSVILNPDYTLTLIFENGDSYTTTSIRGEKGETGDKGQTGATGSTPNITIGTVSTGEEGSSASATITGTTENPILNLIIPIGATGEKGDTGATGQTGQTGATPNISIGTVSTGAEGTNASATITGTAENPILNLTIPRGNTGQTGQTGAKGDTGLRGTGFWRISISPSAWADTIDGVQMVARMLLDTVKTETHQTYIYPDDFAVYGNFLFHVAHVDNDYVYFDSYVNFKGSKGDSGDDYILTAQDKSDIAGLINIPVNDVQINSTSIIQNGIANIPYASNGVPGLAMGDNNYGTANITSNGNTVIGISPADHTAIKAGLNNTNPITPDSQHKSVFYGLAKAAGDNTQSSSSNAVGSYTDSAKAAINQMLDVGVQTVTVNGTTPTIIAQENVRYFCGEVTSVDFTPCANGVCEIMFTSGSTLAVLTLPQTVKMPEWFEMETNHIYEINILDGVYGSVMSWET